MAGAADARFTSLRNAFGWPTRVAVIVVFTVAVTIVWITNLWLTERFTAATRSRAEVRLALYAGNVVSELQRSATVPLLLSRDPALIDALQSGQFTSSSQRLISYLDELGAASLLLLDVEGRVVAATDRNLIGTNYSDRDFFIEAQRAGETVFNATEAETGAFNFSYSRKVTSGRDSLGVIVVEADLAKFEDTWGGISDAVLVTNSEGRIILATEPRWRGLSVEEALAERSAPSAIEQAIQRATADWRGLPPDAYLRGEAVMRNTASIPFRGWEVTAFTTYASVRDQVNAALALEIMGFAILLAGAFYWLSRRARSRSRALERESAELRQLNTALQREMSEREKAEANLAVAEQSLAQSSKLAALGEMSASVSHELNQPLAAMKTYLAGARLLLERKRPVEALSSFQRIDDLIGRMGAITRQLKSYARKGGDAFETFDMRRALSSALSMMEPQLKRRPVEIIRSVPRAPVWVHADRVRLEQVVINLLRNALDATRETQAPRVELILSAGETAILAVRDNGPGIADLDALFEPFYTTKTAGDGVGLGLAISSSIVADLGGRLTARNAEAGGAVFELRLPVTSDEIEAAE